jgi:hypothetical protein
MEDPFVTAATTVLGVAPAVGCKTCWQLLNLSDERRDALQALLSSKIGNRRISTLCQQNGIDLGETTIYTHRTAGHSA